MLPPLSEQATCLSPLQTFSLIPPKKREQRAKMRARHNLVVQASNVKDDDKAAGSLHKILSDYPVLCG
jgi:hypothetical protein